MSINCLISFDLVFKLTSGAFVIVIIILIGVLEIVTVHVIVVLVSIRFT